MGKNAATTPSQTTPPRTSPRVTSTVPASVFRGDIVTVGVSYPVVDPTKVTCVILLPVNDPVTYVQELKVYKRESNLASTGVSCPFLIPDFIQIEGRAIAFAAVDGQGTAATTFEVLP